MFNFSLFRKEMLSLRWRLIGGTAVLTATVVMIHFLFPYLQDIQAMIPQTVPGFPNLQEQLAAIGRNYGIYAWSQWQPKNLTQIGTVLAIVYGMGMIAGERQEGTLNFLFSRPVTRQQIYVTKAVAGVWSLLVATLIPTLLLAVLGRWQEAAFPVGRFLAAYLLVFFGLVLIYLLTLLLSTSMREPVSVAAASAGAVLVLAAIGWLPATREYGLFIIMHGGNYFFTGSFPWVPLAIILLTCVFLIRAGVLLFNRLDV